MEQLRKELAKIVAKIDARKAEEIRIAETISGDLLRDEKSIDTEGREWC